MSTFPAWPSLSACATSYRSLAHWQQQSLPSFGTTITLNEFKRLHSGQPPCSPPMHHSQIFPRRSRWVFNRRSPGPRRLWAWLRCRMLTRPGASLEPYLLQWRAATQPCSRSRRCDSRFSGFDPNGFRRIIDCLRIERRSSTGCDGGCADEAGHQDRFGQARGISCQIPCWQGIPRVGYLGLASRRVSAP
jgi:hypothetical protein